MDGHRQIETARLVPRPLALEHAEALHTLFADPDATHFWHEPTHKDVEATRAMVRTYLSGSERAWVLSIRDGGEVGAPGLRFGTPG